MDIVAIVLILNFKFQTQTYRIEQAKCVVCYPMIKGDRITLISFIFPSLATKDCIGLLKLNSLFIQWVGRWSKNWIDHLKCKCQQVLQVDESFIHEFVHFRFHILLMYAFQIPSIVESYE